MINETLSDASLELMEEYFSEEVADKAEQSLRRLMLSHCRALRTQLAALEKEREGLAKDAERWKWVERNPARAISLIRCGSTPAAIIDMAIEEEGETP